MGDKGVFWLPDAMSTFAGEVDALFWFVFWTSTVLFAAVVGAKLYFMFRYKRKDETSVPEPVHESKILEMAWIVVPTVLVLFVFLWGFDVYLRMNTAPPDSYQITVRGKQWAWEFEYAEGVTTFTEMVVPVGRPVKLTMSSSDVLHSFFIPAFRVKQDIVPNRYSSVWFEATQTGEFQIFCTEYCGTTHSGMLAKVRVVSEEDFASWISEQSQDLPPEQLGAQLFAQCTACHAVDGTVKIGPALNGIFGTQQKLSDGTSVLVDENFIRESILNPAVKVAEGFQPIMPAGYSSMTPKQIDGLVAYIKSLK
mgnify:FL=1